MVFAQYSHILTVVSILVHYMINAILSLSRREMLNQVNPGSDEISFSFLARWVIETGETGVWNRGQMKVLWSQTSLDRYGWNWLGWDPSLRSEWQGFNMSILFKNINISSWCVDCMDIKKPHSIEWGFFIMLTYCIGARGLRDPSSLRSVGMTGLNVSWWQCWVPRDEILRRGASQDNWSL